MMDEVKFVLALFLSMFLSILVLVCCSNTCFADQENARETKKRKELIQKSLVFMVSLLSD